MPRYFFHVYDGVSVMDHEGTELPDWHAAQAAAIDLAGAILRDHSQTIKLGDDWSMEVADPAGLVLFRLDFHIAGSAAIMGSAGPSARDPGS